MWKNVETRTQGSYKPSKQSLPKVQTLVQPARALKICMKMDIFNMLIDTL